MTSPSYPDLADASVVVTGGGSGIGRAVADLLAQQGARVALLGRTVEPLERAVDELRATGARAEAIRCDVASEDSVERALATVSGQFGGLDILINCAARTQPRTLVADMDRRLWDDVLAVNLTGPMLCAKHAIPMLARSERAAIVNVASLGAHRARIGNSAYTAAKIALVHLTRTLALELAASGIRVNAVSPGATRTPLLARVAEERADAGTERRVVGDLADYRLPIPTGRISQPVEQAAVIVFLASAAASFVTGQVLPVDGGESAA